MNQGDFIFDIQPLRQFMKSALALQQQSRPFNDEDCDACLMQAVGMALRGATPEKLSEYLLGCCSAMGVQADTAVMDEAGQRILAEVSKARPQT